MKRPKQQSFNFVGVRPLSDRLLIKRLEYKHETLEVVGGTLQKGIVIAAGPGRRERRKVRFDKKMGGMSTDGALYFEDGEETGRTYPMPVKVGDVVEFSPRGQIEWEFEGETYVWVWVKACYGTTDDSQSEALLWQQSAGFDRKGNFLSGAEQWQRN